MGRSGRSVTLSWVAPTSDGGGGLCGYRVEMKAAATGEWQLCHELVPGPECVVDGLAPGETYRFRVAAVGPAGAGEPVHLPQTVRLGESQSWSWPMSVEVQPGALRPAQAGGPGHDLADVPITIRCSQQSPWSWSLCLLPLRAGRCLRVRMCVWSVRWQRRERWSG